MVVMASDGTSLAEQQQVLGWIHGMADQNAGEASIEPLLLLGESNTMDFGVIDLLTFFFLSFLLTAMCFELGIGTPQNITEAKRLYEKAVTITTTSETHWPQQNACFRLAKLCVDQQLYETALAHFQALKLKLRCMNHHSPETRLQARQVRYYLGTVLTS